MNMQTIAHGNSKPVERRDNPPTRARYDAALFLLKPLLSNPQSFNGASLYLAMSRLQKAFPDMSGNEIEALATSVLRALQKRAADID